MGKGAAAVLARLMKAQALAGSRPAEAIELLEKICRKQPRNADAWFMRGTVLGNSGRFAEAVDCLQRAVELRPDHILSYFNLGNAFSGQGAYGDAATAFSSALRLDSGRPEIMRALARAEVNSGRPAAAARVYADYLQLRPQDPEVYGNLGSCHFHLGELEEAARCYRQALALKQDAAWFDGLGATLCQQGDHEAAIAAHRAAVRLQPDNSRYYSNLLLSLHYLPDISAQEVFYEHTQWAQTLRDSAAWDGVFDNSREADRRLRIGYVSPDLRTHSVAYFFEPLLQQHNHENFETYCYFCGSIQDETTQRLRQAADHWRDIRSLDDQVVVEGIRSDGIDILVDLAGHTAGNRLDLFARRPAPVQLTWLGYPATTGLCAMDYRLTDAIADPLDEEVFGSERLAHVPGCFLCYGPPANSPDVSPLPMLENGFPTFGSFNNLAKINERVVALWSEILHAVMGSRMLIKNPSLSDPATADRYRKLFAQHDISPDRVELLGLAPTTAAHLATYQRIDIALDTFPYNGTTTTCEALYMGVPVITLVGKAHAGRVGASLLSALGMQELVAFDHNEYLAVAKRLAENRVELSELRGCLRTRMKHSPLCDSRLFAEKLEQVYRNLWRDWCNQFQ